MLDPRCPQPISRQRQQRHHQQAKYILPAQAMFPEHLQYVCQQTDARAEQDQPWQIERLSFPVIIRQILPHHVQSQQPDRQVRKEDCPPVQIAHDQSARKRSQHRTNQRRDRHKTHRANQLTLRKRPHQRQPSHRHHHRSAATLQNPAYHQFMDVRRQPTQQ